MRALVMLEAVVALLLKNQNHPRQPYNVTSGQQDANASNATSATVAKTEIVTESHQRLVQTCHIEGTRCVVALRQLKKEPYTPDRGASI